MLIQRFKLYKADLLFTQILSDVTHSSSKFYNNYFLKMEANTGRINIFENLHYVKRYYFQRFRMRHLWDHNKQINIKFINHH